MRYGRAVGILAASALALSATHSQAVDYTYKYDGLGRLVRLDSPYGDYTTYTHDGPGNRTQKVVSLSLPTANENYTSVSGSGGWPWAWYEATGCMDVVANDTDPQSEPLTISSINWSGYEPFSWIEENQLCFTLLFEESQIFEVEGYYTVTDGHPGHYDTAFFRFTINY